jgi:hypothetical protein
MYSKEVKLHYAKQHAAARELAEKHKLAIKEPVHKEFNPNMRDLVESETPVKLSKPFRAVLELLQSNREAPNPWKSKRIYFEDGSYLDFESPNQVIGSCGATAARVKIQYKLRDVVLDAMPKPQVKTKSPSRTKAVHFTPFGYRHIKDSAPTIRY